MSPPETGYKALLPRQESPQHVPRDFGILAQPSHGVRVPVPPIGDVDAQAVAGGEEDAAQLVIDAEEHLELVAVAGHAVLVEKGGGGAGEIFVVGGDADVDAPGEQLLQGA